MDSPDFLFPRFLVFPPANLSNFSLFTLQMFFYPYILYIHVYTDRVAVAVAVGSDSHVMRFSDLFTLITNHDLVYGNVVVKLKLLYDYMSLSPLQEQHAMKSIYQSCTCSMSLKLN